MLHKAKVVLLFGFLGLTAACGEPGGETDPSIIKEISLKPTGDHYTIVAPKGFTRNGCGYLRTKYWRADAAGFWREYYDMVGAKENKAGGKYLDDSWVPDQRRESTCDYFVDEPLSGTEVYFAPEFYSYSGEKDYMGAPATQLKTTRAIRNQITIKFKNAAGQSQSINFEIESPEAMGG